MPGYGPSPLTRGTPRRPRAAHPSDRSIPAHAGNTRLSGWLSPPRAVHPRSRGEHSSPCSVSRSARGPSPLTRGTLGKNGLKVLGWRSIPAHAGNTSDGKGRGLHRTVHPRSRGEHQRSLGVQGEWTGPSPLTRGTRGIQACGQRLRRSIPAHAGNTSKSSSTIDEIPGPSPLTRGTRVTVDVAAVDSRSIPAHAGNTLIVHLAAFGRPVHPRSRGEHDAWPWLNPIRDGPSPLTRGTPAAPSRSSGVNRSIPAHAGNTATLVGTVIGYVGPFPLTRGTLAAAILDFMASRSIPAHAGNTFALCGYVGTPTVHPRSRGEHLDIGLSPDAEAGPSPLTRGTRLHLGGDRRISRSIPAHAGNTHRCPAARPRSSVHPRSRGEHFAVVDGPHALAGPSPLTRGTRDRPGSWNTEERSIPAHAGNTRAPPGAVEPASVHPRSRGEHASAWKTNTGTYGPSPLTRGTR